jgi:hypothetical protein
MRRYTRYAATALATAALAAGLTACGSSSSSPGSTSTASASDTAAWADGLCGALVTWRSTIQSTIPKPGSGKLTLDGLKQSATEVSDANDKLASAIHDLGKPPTPTAEKAKADAQNLADELKSERKKITDATSSISGAGDVLPAVSAITAALTAMGDDLKATAGQLESAASDKNWQNAFHDSSSCQKLSRSSG